MQSGQHGVKLLITGKSLKQLEQSAGGHRIQRVPPTEKRGRVHTSTVTVAVIDPEQTVTTVEYPDSDFRVEWFRGTGAGGQHRNKHANSCRIIHIPTGTVESRQGRKRDSNYREAKIALEAKLTRQAQGEIDERTAKTRKKQVGSGMRADKVVTIRFQDNRVQHHGTGKSMKANKFMKGWIDELWDQTVYE